MICNRGASENDAKEGVMAKFVQFQAHHLDVSLAAHPPQSPLHISECSHSDGLLRKVSAAKINVQIPL